MSCWRRALHVFKLSIIHCTLFIAIPAYANEEETPEDFTAEVLQAMKYERCQDALNLLLDKERTDDTLSTQHRYLMAEAFACLGSTKTALRIYSDLLKLDKENALYTHRRMILHAQQQRWKQAHADCLQLQYLMPREISYCKVCGEVALEVAQYDDAYSFLRRHLQAHTHDVDALYVVAKIYLKTGKYNDALLAINDCITAMPHMGEYRLLRAQIYEQQGVLNFAADEYAAYLKQFSTNHKVWLQYGQLLQKLQRKTEACQAFELSQVNGNLDAGKFLHRYCR
jgi:predicted Zn-dependent protease